MDIQVIIDAVKDYGAAIISTLSVGGIAGIAVFIAKIKETFNATKETMDKVLAKKDNIIDNTKSQLAETSSKMDIIISQNAELAKENRELKEVLTKIKK